MGYDSFAGGSGTEIWADDYGYWKFGLKISGDQIKVKCIQKNATSSANNGVTSRNQELKSKIVIKAI